MAQQTTTDEAQTPDEASALLQGLREGDRVRFSGDEWKVISEAEDDFLAVEFKALSGYHPGTTTLKPSSGFRNSCVVTHSRGMGSHYGSIEVVARSMDHQPDDAGRTQGERVVQDAQEGDTVEVADRERGSIRTEDSTGTYEVVERVNGHVLKVKRDGGGYARMRNDATGEGVRVLMNGNSDPGAVWHEAHLVRTDGGTVVEDGGQPLDEDEDENPHQHASVWSAAANLETHEDGSAPRLGVEYRKKNGSGTARKAGTVEHVEVQQPDEKMGREVGQPVPRIVFERDDGQRMYVEPDGLYTVGSHAPYVGSVVALTTSTTSTVGVPEGVAQQRDSEDEGDDSPSVRVPSVDSLDDLAEWVNRQGADDLHAEVGTTHYSWDIPGFGRQNDPHNGFTAKRGGECAYLEVRGPRSERVEQALAELAHRHDLEDSTSSHRVTLVPPQDW